MSFVSSTDSLAGTSSMARHAAQVAEQALDQFRGQVLQRMFEGELPDLFKKYIYKVYTLTGSSFGSHWSIVLSKDETTFFTVELVVDVSGEEHQVRPRMQVLDESKQENLKYKGEVEGTGFSLINKALGVMERLGDYSVCANNCQRYCNSVLSEYGLGENTDWTDFGKTAAGIGVGLAAAGLAVLTGLGLAFSSSASGREDEEDDE